jgi:CDP-diacylglycerol--glycerol-3-phosphate 3-phosphatidyltransferase
MAYRVKDSIKERRNNMNLPNKITTFRMVCVVIIIFLLLFPWKMCGIEMPVLFNDVTLEYFLSFIIFVVASISDFLDGYIARKYNLVTTYGKFMDPIADKLLVNSTIIILASQIPSLVIVAVVMIARDIVVDALRLIAVSRNKVVAANIWGKLKTVTQMVAICFVLLNDFPFSFIPWDINVSLILCYVAGVCSLLSMVVYIIQNREVFKDE